RIVVRDKLPALGIVFIHTAVESAYPERAGQVFIERNDLIAADAVGIFWITMIDRKPSALRVEFVQSGCCTDPKRARSVLTNRLPIITAQTIGVAGVVAVDCKLSALRVEPVQSDLSSNPEHPRTVFISRFHSVAA